MLVCFMLPFYQNNDMLAAKPFVTRRARAMHKIIYIQRSEDDRSEVFSETLQQTSEILWPGSFFLFLVVGD